MKLNYLIHILFCCFSFTLTAQGNMPVILDLKAQGELHDQWLKERFVTIVPELMRREGVDMWLLISREYNEDPVLKTMLPSNWMGARRTTMLIAFDTGDEIETLACARYDVGEVFKKAWDKDQQPNQWVRLREIIEERNPKKIAINRSEHFGLADGLSAYHYEKLLETLPKAYQDKLVSGEKLAIGWLETRLPAEMVVYRQVMQIAHQIIAEALSERVIQPGYTSTDDVVWYMRERSRELGVEVWFHPTVDVQRSDPAGSDHLRSFSRRPDKVIIQPGDLVHCDFGITYCRLNTDTQQNAYVLKPGESAPPAYLVAAHRKGLQVMDHLTDEFRNGATGNEMLLGALKTGKDAGFRPTIYSHPIGYHGHGAGPTIGLWDQQGGVPFRGDYPLYPNTAYSIELNTAVFIKEWDMNIRMMMEEDGFWDGKSFHYLNGRQTSLFTIPRMK
ncbi:MAG: M24 family metallopeptidase [Bacteroidota bacterium]